MDEVKQERPAEPGPSGRPSLLDRHGDDVLLGFGVPEVLLFAVRAVTRPEDLLVLGKHLPSEAAGALVWLAEGTPPRR